MKLLTKELLKQFPTTCQTDGKPKDQVMVIAKYFHCLSDYTFYATEYSPENREFFGLVVNCFGKELGYVSLDELEQTKVKGIGIERDLYFRPVSLASLMEG